MNAYREKNLIEAFDLYVQQQNTLLPTDEQLREITFSPEFEAKMAQILRRRRQGYYLLFGTVARRVASIVVVLLVSAAIVTASVEALRTPVVQFFAEVYERFTQIFVADDTADLPAAVELEPHALTYIPEGYELEICTDTNTTYKEVYVNNNGQRIIITQKLTNNFDLTIDTENIECTQIRIGSYDGVTYTNKEKTFVIVMASDYMYSVSASIDVGELIKIAESIAKQ